MDHKEEFRFTYSAEQQREVEYIRSKYLPKEENKLDRLRRLDAGVYAKARSWAITLGILGALVMGFGMSLCMTELGAALGVYAMALGIAVGVTGMILAALAWPVYRHVLQKERSRIAPEILRLSEELMG